MLAVLLLLLFGMNTTALALEVPDESRSGEISVTMQDPETLAAVPKGTMTLYRVADIYTENRADFSFVLTKDFKDSGAKLETLDAALAQQLAEYAKAAALHGETGEIGSDGKAVFSGLKPGLFLLVQDTPAEGCFAVKPFLVSIPLEETDGSYIYDVDATPKMELLRKEPPPDESDNPPDGPQTGTPSNLGLWLIMIALSSVGICVTFILGRKHKKSSK